MQKIFWVCNNVETALHYLKNSMINCWNLDDSRPEEIVMKFLVAGEDGTYTKMSEQQDRDRIFHIFQDECCQYDGPASDRPMFFKKNYLVDDPVKYLYNKDDRLGYADYCHLKVNWKQNQIERYRKLKLKYPELSELSYKDIPDAAVIDSQMSENAQKYAAKLADKIRKEIEPGCKVGIQMDMFGFEDIETMRTGGRILSMELIHQLSDLDCFVFSLDNLGTFELNGWEKIYEKLYGKTDIPTVCPPDMYYQPKCGNAAAEELIYMLKN